jgi:hypothetical protein
VPETKIEEELIELPGDDYIDYRFERVNIYKVDYSKGNTRHSFMFQIKDDTFMCEENGIKYCAAVHGKPHHPDYSQPYPF